MLRRLRAMAYFYVGDYCSRRGNFIGAVAYHSKVIRLCPNNHFVYNDRGVAFQGMGDYRRAIDDFDRAIEIDPHLAVAYLGRGVSWKFLGDHDRALADQIQAVALAPRNADAYAELGTAYQRKQDFDLSLAHLTTAINLAPKEPSHLKHRGYTQFYRGDFEAAAADLRRSLDLGDDAYAILFHYLARVRTSKTAIFELETLAKKLRSRRWPVAMIGLYLGKLPVDTALAAATNSDERAEAQFYLGEWHLLRNDRTEAIKALQAAAQSCPTWFIEHTAAVAELKRLE
jgi:tetratricopeptide (TPR) repeat protein